LGVQEGLEGRLVAGLKGGLVLFDKSLVLLRAAGVKRRRDQRRHNSHRKQQSAFHGSPPFPPWSYCSGIVLPCVCWPARDLWLALLQRERNEWPSNAAPAFCRMPSIR